MNAFFDSFVKALANWIEAFKEFISNMQKMLDSKAKNYLHLSLCAKKFRTRKKNLKLLQKALLSEKG